MKVLLVHGLGRTRLSMVLLARRLARSGHDALFFGYSALTESQPGIVSRLEARLREIASTAERSGSSVTRSAGCSCAKPSPACPRCA